MIARKILIITLVVAFGWPLFTSCKKECPPHDIKHLEEDTAVVPYTALETLKFLVKDTLGNVVDTVAYIGQGKRIYIGDFDAAPGSGYEKCREVTDLEAVDYIFQNAKDPSETLVITITRDGYDSKLEFWLKTKYTATNSDHFFFDWFSGRTSDFKSRSTNLNDSITVLGKTYYSVIQLGFTPHKNSGKMILNLYFGKFDGVIFLEETSNRSWYKIN